MLHTRQKLFPTGLAVTIAVPISTIGNSALLIGAAYMIVNGFAFDPGGLWSEAVLPPDLADLIHRVLAVPTRAEGSSSHRDSSTSRTVHGVHCEGDTADGKKELAVTPQARSSLWRRTRQVLMALDRQTSAARPRRSRDVSFP